MCSSFCFENDLLQVHIYQITGSICERRSGFDHTELYPARSDDGLDSGDFEPESRGGIGQITGNGLQVFDGFEFPLFVPDKTDIGHEIALDVAVLRINGAQTLNIWVLFFHAQKDRLDVWVCGFG